MAGRGSGLTGREGDLPDWLSQPLPRKASRPSSRGSAAAGASSRAAEGAGARRPAGGRRAGQRPRAARSAAPGPGVKERRLLLVGTLLLLTYGLVMAYSASAAQAYFNYGSSYYLFEKQLLFAGAGLVALFVCARVDYGLWRRAALPFAIVVVVLLLAVLVPGIGTSVNGARRWIIVGGQSMTPSEFAKLAAVILIASLIARRPREVTEARGLLRLAAIGIVPAAVLIMLEPDLGTTLVLSMAVMAVLVAGGARLRHMSTLVICLLACVVVLVAVEPYRMARITAFIHPWSDPQGAGFQTTQSLISIASGHVFGVGLGNSVQKFGYLPQQTTDMITGIIGEELGLVGLLALVGLYVFLAWSAFRIALRCRELFGKLLAVGIVSVVVGQACINIGAALGLLPLTGVPLPLVSCGGTNLMVTLTAIGILLNIATNRRSFIVVSAQRGSRTAGRGRDRRSPGAGPSGSRRARR